MCYLLLYVIVYVHVYITLVLIVHEVELFTECECEEVGRRDILVHDVRYMYGQIMRVDVCTGDRSIQALTATNRNHRQVCAVIA